MATSDMGPSPPRAGEYLLRRQFEQHPLRPHKYLSQHHGMATIWHNTFRSASRLLWHHVRLRRSRDRTNFREKLWMDELDWRGDPISVPMFASLV